jgi:hypothetical protein
MFCSKLGVRSAVAHRVQRPSRVLVQCTSSARPASLESWTTGTLQLAAFFPRVATGLVLSAREQLPLLETKLQRVVDIAASNHMSESSKLVRPAGSCHAFSKGSHEARGVSSANFCMLWSLMLRTSAINEMS